MLKFEKNKYCFKSKFSILNWCAFNNV